MISKVVKWLRGLKVGSMGWLTGGKIFVDYFVQEVILITIRNMDS